MKEQMIKCIYDTIVNEARKHHEESICVASVKVTPTKSGIARMLTEMYLSEDETVTEETENLINYLKSQISENGEDYIVENDFPDCGNLPSADEMFLSFGKMIKDITLTGEIDENNCTKLFRFDQYKYNEMTYEEFRTYLIWRSALRENRVVCESYSFQKLYIYELINFIIESTPIDVWNRLTQMENKIQDLQFPFLENIKRDFAILYGPFESMTDDDIRDWYYVHRYSEHSWGTPYYQVGFISKYYFSIGDYANMYRFLNGSTHYKPKNNKLCKELNGEQLFITCLPNVLQRINNLFMKNGIQAFEYWIGELAQEKEYITNEFINIKKEYINRRVINVYEDYGIHVDEVVTRNDFVKNNEIAGDMDFWEYPLKVMENVFKEIIGLKGKSRPTVKLFLQKDETSELRQSICKVYESQEFTQVIRDTIFECLQC